MISEPSNGLTQSKHPGQRQNSEEPSHPSIEKVNKIIENIRWLQSKVAHSDSAKLKPKPVPAKAPPAVAESSYHRLERLLWLSEGRQNILHSPCRTKGQRPVSKSPLALPPPYSSFAIRLREPFLWASKRQDEAH